eukprot:1994357-Rhodomonas_salina.1
MGGADEASMMLQNDNAKADYPRTFGFVGCCSWYIWTWELTVELRNGQVTSSPHPIDVVPSRVP